MSLLKIGFCGLGLMGSRMAMNLKKKGFEVTVWNRSPAAAQALKAQGISVASSPAALAAGVDAFCTCVADVGALESVALGPQGLLEGAKEGQLYIEFSTVSVALVKKLEAAFAAKGVDFADAPVTGSKGGAEKGTLVMMTGATEATLARAQVEAGQQFRRQVQAYWEACEQWANAQLEAPEAAAQGAAQKRGSKEPSTRKSSPRSKRS